MQAVDALLFDLDGTLVDTAPDISDALDRAMEQVGLPAVGEAQTRQWVGNGAAKLVERALAAAMHGESAPALKQKALALFLDAYGRAICVRSRLYPGVREGLDRLRADGYRLACVTNKPQTLARELLLQLDFGDAWFPVVVGGDTLALKKPDAAPLQHAMQGLGVLAARTLMVGDSVTDVRAARNAGVAVACVPYGYNHGVDIHHARPDLVIDNLILLHRLLLSAA